MVEGSAMLTSLLLCALITASVADSKDARTENDVSGSVDGYVKAKWLALHSLKSHPSREDTAIFKGFGNFNEYDGVDEESIVEYLNEENAQLLLQQQPTPEHVIGDGRNMDGGTELHQSSITEDSRTRPPSSENTKDDDFTDTAELTDSAERAPLIYAESNKNRDGWLMPDDTIPE